MPPLPPIVTKPPEFPPVALPPPPTALHVECDCVGTPPVVIPIPEVVTLTLTAAAAGSGRRHQSETRPPVVPAAAAAAATDALREDAVAALLTGRDGRGIIDRDLFAIAGAGAAAAEHDKAAGEGFRFRRGRRCSPRRCRVLPHMCPGTSVVMELPPKVVTETLPPSAASPALVEPQKMAEQLPVEPPAPPRLCALMPLESVPFVLMVPVKLTVTELAAPPAPPSPGSPPRLAVAPPPLPPLPAALIAARPTADAPEVEIAPLTVTETVPPLPPPPPSAPSPAR